MNFGKNVIERYPETDERDYVRDGRKGCQVLEVSHVVDEYEGKKENDHVYSNVQIVPVLVDDVFHVRRHEHHIHTTNAQLIG